MPIGEEDRARRNLADSKDPTRVCTENLNPDVVVMKSAKDGMRPALTLGDSLRRSNADEVFGTHNGTVEVG